VSQVWRHPAGQVRQHPRAVFCKLQTLQRVRCGSIQRVRCGNIHVLCFVSCESCSKSGVAVFSGSGVATSTCCVLLVVNLAASQVGGIQRVRCGNIHVLCFVSYEPCSPDIRRRICEFHLCGMVPSSSVHPFSFCRGAFLLGLVPFPAGMVFSCWGDFLLGLVPFPAGVVLSCWGWCLFLLGWCFPDGVIFCWGWCLFLLGWCFSVGVLFCWFWCLFLLGWCFPARALFCWDGAFNQCAPLFFLLHLVSGSPLRYCARK